MTKFLATIFLAWAALAAPGPAAAEEEYLLGAGDIIRITVFQNPDLATEVRVSESGHISFPLLGSVALGGKTVPGAERAIADGLRKGGFVLAPQVIVFPLQIRGNQVSVLGQVNRPGRYPLETTNLRVADLVALAGGVAPGGADSLVLTGLREGGPIRREIPVAELVARSAAANETLAGGDIIFVDRAPTYYIYGEVQKPGAYRLEQGMTLMQALATGGGLTNRGTERGMEVHRRDGSGKVAVIRLDRNEALRPDDVVYVKESLF
jgi:polysaccharide export outer membrane protein